MVLESRYVQYFQNLVGPDGAKYEGEWIDNKASGKGKFWHVDGDYFEG